MYIPQFTSQWKDTSNQIFVSIHVLFFFNFPLLVQAHLYLMKETRPKSSSNTTVRSPYKFIRGLHLYLFPPLVLRPLHISTSLLPRRPWLWWESSKRPPQLWSVQIDGLSTQPLPLAISYLPSPGKWRPHCFAVLYTFCLHRWVRNSLYLGKYM